jgi:hypothetical protein
VSQAERLLRTAQIKTSLTIKPKGFYMHVKQRKDRLVTSIASATSHSPQGQEQSNNVRSATEIKGKGPKLAIYYGAWASTGTIVRPVLSCLAPFRKQRRYLQGFGLQAERRSDPTRHDRRD